MSPPWTSAEISAYDQHLASADTEISLLVSCLNISISEAGEHQALANVLVLLNAREDKRGLLGLLSAALLRIARTEAQVPS